MSRVVVALKGGLGNQLFEYAAGLAVATKLGLPLVLDVSAYDDPRERHFALQPFELPDPLSHCDIHRWSRGSLLDRLYRRVAQKIGLRRCGLPVFSERGFGFDVRFREITKGVVLDGYFQSSSYFSEVEKLVRERISAVRTLTPASSAMLQKIRETDAICVHVRRGDYVTNPVANQVHGLCGMDYYARGLEVVGEDMCAPQCFVFSDDPEWVRENMTFPYPASVVDINGERSAHEDLWLMAACRSFVIANSSLSWWGAWLGNHPGKRVVAPLQWFKGRNVDTSELIPDAWIRC